MELGIEIASVVGALIGNMVATLAPYYYEKKKLGFEDIDIFFDKKFLKSTVVSFILASVSIGYSYPLIMQNVPPAASIISAAVSAGVFAMTMNWGGNKLLGPSEITMKAKKDALKSQTQTILATEINKTIKELNSIPAPKNNAEQLERLNDEVCGCKKCCDD